MAMNDEELRRHVRNIVPECGEGEPCKTCDDRADKIAEFIKSHAQQIALAEQKKINGGDVHKVLMSYGQICEEQGSLSPKAVTIRMDLATYFYDLEATLKQARGDK